MFNDPAWFFTDEPTVMWGRQLEYRTVRDGVDHVRTPDRRTFTTLRRAFALYRVGMGERGPGEEQLEVMRRTLSWLHCRRYEQPIVPAGDRCVASARHEKVDDRRIVVDVFGGSRALYEHYLLHLEMLRLTTVIGSGDYGLTREGQASLLMLEITRRRSGILADVGSLDRLQKLGRWITVDPNRWAAGFIVADEQGCEPV